MVPSIQKFTWNSPMDFLRTRDKYVYYREASMDYDNLLAAGSIA
jgi:hypothetical protein